MHRTWCVSASLAPQLVGAEADLLTALRRSTGGRAGLTRVASVIGEVYVSYQVPEYSAYDQSECAESRARRGTLADAHAPMHRQCSRRSKSSCPFLLRSMRRMRTISVSRRRVGALLGAS